jgi:hypothetical protein
MSSSKSLAGQILWWLSDRRSGYKKDEQATGHARIRGRGSCPLDQESTLDMVLLDIILSGQKRSLGQQKVPNLCHNDQGLSKSMPQRSGIEQGCCSNMQEQPCK